MKEDPIQLKFFKEVERQRLFKPYDRVVVAVSGGPDSMALISLLASLKDFNLPLVLAIAHLNHGLRKEAILDENLVKKTAEEMGIPFIVKRIEPHWESSIEEKAREIRYGFLQEAAQSFGSNIVAFGHNADDQSETILWRFLEGTGLTGLAGMPVSRPIVPSSKIHIVRPLLSFFRKEILVYLEAENIPWREDSSNSDLSFQRNRIRHQIFPFIEKAFKPGIKNNLLRLGQIVSDTVSWITEETEELWTKINKPPCPEHPDLGKVISSWAGLPAMLVAIDPRELGSCPSPLIPFILRKAALSLTEEHVHFEHTHIQCLESLINGNGKFLIGAGHFIMREHGLILFGKSQSQLKPPCLNLQVPGKTILPGGGIIETSLIDREKTEEPLLGVSSLTEYMDFDSLSFPLSIRIHRPGDCICPLKSKENRKVSHILSKEKIPTLWRSLMPVLVSGDDRICWLMGLNLDDRVRLNPQTKNVLVIRLIAENKE